MYLPPCDCPYKTAWNVPLLICAHSTAYLQESCCYSCNIGIQAMVYKKAEVKFIAFGPETKEFLSTRSEKNELRCLFEFRSISIFVLLFAVPLETGSQVWSPSFSRPWPRSWRPTLLCMSWESESGKVFSCTLVNLLNRICHHRTMENCSQTRLFGL